MATQTSIELLEPVVSPAKDDDLHPHASHLNLSMAGPESTEAIRQYLSRGRSIIVMIQLAAINFVTSLSNGIITVALPAMATSLGLKASLIVWPSAASYLTSGTCLLLAGTFADVIGPRKVYLAGCFLVSVFILAQALAQTGIQLIMFRALSGVAIALTFPSSVSIISTSVESGRRRNIGFASLGLAMPLGFSFGMTIGGLLTTGPGWRSGFYIGAAASFLLFVVGIWSLPPDVSSSHESSVKQRLAREVDWIGALIASVCLALISYVLATLSTDIHLIKTPLIIVFLTISVILAPVFVLWMNRRQRQDKPALIPNSLWRNGKFTTICIMVLLGSAVANSVELYSSLFFQEVQHLSALQASLRILPNMLVGAIMNLSIGAFINKVPALYAVVGSTTLSIGGPLLMAVIDPRWPYWYDAFFAQLLAPMSIDVLFTVGLLVVSDSFPQRTQALAGAVFNTVAQLGTSIGLTTTSVIATAVTGSTKYQDKTSPAALLPGYRATFWTLVAWTAVACVAGAVGLRSLGKIGQKRD